jgi:hypothetical protein
MKTIITAIAVCLALAAPASAAGLGSTVTVSKTPPSPTHRAANNTKNDTTLRGLAARGRISKSYGYVDNVPPRCQGCNGSSNK